MDDDVLAARKPTCHVEFDEATALLAGDALQSLAFQLLAEHRLADDPMAQIEMVKLLAAAAGSRAWRRTAHRSCRSRRHAVAAGTRVHAYPQDRRADPRRDRCSVRVVARRPIRELEQLDRFAKFIGLAFQVVDDVLDTDATTATLGKTAGKDARQNKPTTSACSALRTQKKLAGELRGKRACRARRFWRARAAPAPARGLYRAAKFLMYELLKTINDRVIWRALDRKQLPQLAQELRQFCSIR